MEVDQSPDIEMKEPINATGLNETQQFNFELFLEKYLKDKQEEQNEAALDPTTRSILIAMYCVLICIGAFGNSLVCIAVIKKPQMRTARNLFIINLAISDLTLCLFTMPFTLVQSLMTYWPLGDFTCKMVHTFQATNVFVSTISITAIALDRYSVIVYPTKQNMQKIGAVLTLTSIWVFCLFLALPMFLFHAKMPWPPGDWNFGVTFYWMCAETWPEELQHRGPFVYAVMAMVFQYVVPIAVVSAAYIRICHKLQYRMVTQVSSTQNQRKKELDERRKRKTNQLLIAIGAVFAISWLPLNLFNLATLYDVDAKMLNQKDENLIFSVCHMMGMSSACSNPLLYGWLNDNFRKEFNEILCHGWCCVYLRLKRQTRREPVPVVIYTKPNDEINNTHLNVNANDNEISAVTANTHVDQMQDHQHKELQTASV